LIARRSINVPGKQLPVLNAPFVLGHRPALDGLRGLAILAVMGVHIVPFLPGGYIGVDVFFVLSGFLITALLLQERAAAGAINLRAFYWRRALRLLPAVTAMLLVCWLMGLVFPSSGLAADMRSSALCILCYCYNWYLTFLPAQPTPVLAPLWSLSVEEQFYLLWPPIFAGLLALNVRPRWILAVVLLGMIAPALERLALGHGHSGVRLYVGTDSRADGLFSGCLVALLAFQGLTVRGSVARFLLRAGAWVALLVLTGLCFCLRSEAAWVMYYGGFTIVNGCAAVLIAALIWAPPRLLVQCLELRPLGWVGRVSYGLYIWHILVFHMANHWLGGVRFLVRLPLALVVTFAVAAVSFYCLERPFLRLTHLLRPVRLAHPGLSNGQHLVGWGSLTWKAARGPRPNLRPGGGIVLMPRTPLPAAERPTQPAPTAGGRQSAGAARG
jgi:peptidoglycan/LPS O-acetylase OafA/YrhL